MGSSVHLCFVFTLTERLESKTDTLTTPYRCGSEEVKSFSMQCTIGSIKP